MTDGHTLFADPTAEFLTPLARHSSRSGFTYRSGTLDDVRRHMSAKFLPHRLRYLGGAEQFDFETAWVPFGSFSLNMTRYAGEVEVSSDQPGDFVALQFSLAGECQVGCAEAIHEVNPGSLWIMDARRPIYQRMAPGYVQLNVRFQLSTLRQFIARERGEHRLDTLRFSDQPIELSSLPGSTRRFFNYLCREAVADEQLFESDLFSRQIELSAMAALLSLAPGVHQPRPADPFRYERPYFVRQAEAFIREHATAELTIEDITRAAQVSERSLYEGFRRYLGVSPMNYLKNYRLELARCALAGSTGPCRVTEVAMNVGFTHLGKFAGSYKRRFGESPSQTLRLRGVER